MTVERLAGRVALVTGGASGIGKAIAERFASEGAHLVLADRQLEAAKQTAASIGRGCLAIATEVTDRGSVDAAVAATIAAHGRLNILVTSAGISRPAPLLEMTEADWRAVVDVNLTGTFLAIQAAARPMAARGWGRIICIASNCAQRATSYRASYNASKGGVISLVQSAAIELAGAGITVNAISPGPIDSPMSRKNHTPALRRAIMGVTPMKRYGDAAEIAATASFLASADASYLTGQELSVDGGAGAALYLYDDTEPPS